MRSSSYNPDQAIASSLLAGGVPQSIPALGSSDEDPGWMIWRGPEALRVVSVRRSKIVSLTAGFFALCGIIVAIAFFRTPGIHASLPWLSLALSAELLFVPWLLREERNLDFCGALVITTLVGYLVLAAYLYGGLNQPIIGMVTVVPVLATVMLSPRAGVLVTFGLCAVLSWFLVLHLNGYIPGVTLGTVDGDQSILRGCVMMLGTIVAAAAIWAYESRTQVMLERHRAEQENDVVTGLMNRWQFELKMREQLQKKTNGRHQASLLLMDLNGFDEVARDLGHAARDELLRRCAASIQASVLSPDSLVGRMDGECFALFCWSTSRWALRTLNDRIQLLIEGATQGQALDHRQRVEISTGIGLLSPAEQHGERAAEILYARASQAQVAAREAGANKLRYESVAA